MMVFQRPLACLAIVVILLAATVSAQEKPAGVVTCGKDGFSMVITKAFEDGKIEVIDVTIGSGTTDGKTDNDCVFTDGDVSNSLDSGTNQPIGAVVTQNDISGKAKLPYGTDTSGADGMAKCGGTLKDKTVQNAQQQDVKVIEYSVEIEVVVRETTSNIKREIKWKFDLACQLTKAVDAKGGVQGWTIDRESLAAESTGAAVDTKTFTFDIEINFLASEGGAAITDGATYTMGGWVYVQVKETTPSAIFKFVTKKCWFSPSTALDTKYTFFDNYCPIGTDPNVDDFTALSGNTDSDFDMKTKAFFFTGKDDDKVIVYCDLFICLTDDTSAECTQKTRTEATDSGGCGMTSKRRRRNVLPELLRTKRSVDDKNNRGWIEHRVVQSKQAIILDRNDVIVPKCGGDFVYDRVAKICSNENLLEISGLYLDIPWNVEYANFSSQTFKDFASGKAYQLYVLTQMTDGGNDIVGLDVVSAKKGSVILTVRIKYSARSNAASAFEVFQRAVFSSESQRAANVLNIRSDKVIEYVEIKRPSPSSGLSVEILTLVIAIVVVLCAAVFISVIAVLKVRHARRGASNNAGSEMKAHDNPNFS